MAEQTDNNRHLSKKKIFCNAAVAVNDTSLLFRINDCINYANKHPSLHSFSEKARKKESIFFLILLIMHDKTLGLWFLMLCLHVYSIRENGFICTKVNQTVFPESETQRFAFLSSYKDHSKSNRTFSTFMLAENIKKQMDLELQ